MPHHSLRSSQLHFGWSHVGLICDKEDAYSTSLFEILKTTLTNDAGVVGARYDTSRLEIDVAERIDLDKDSNATKDALIAALKAKDVKVIILLGQTAFVDGILTYGRDKGIFSPGLFQFIAASAIYPDTMAAENRAALDGMLVTTVAGISPEYSGFQRSKAFWIKHPPRQRADEANMSIPFMVSGRKARFQDAALYDSIRLAAVAIDACLKDGCRPVGHGYEEVMPYFRAVSIEGVAGPTSIKAGSNDPGGRIFAVSVGKNPASRGRGVGGPYTFEEVTVTSTTIPELQVCVEPRIGNQCSDRSASPESVKCFASSATSIDVEWNVSVPQGGLLTGYRVTAYAFDEQARVRVNSTAETRVTFATYAVNNAQVKHNLVYTITVEAEYDNATILSKAVSCQVPQDGLPCIPPPVVAYDDEIRQESRLLPSNRSFKPVCGCRSTEFHTKGMPPAASDPPLQPYGRIEGPARDWNCESCPDGVQCMGGTAATITVQKGWFMLRHVSKTTGAEKRPVLMRCASSVACPGGMLILAEMARRASASFCNAHTDEIPAGFCNIPPGMPGAESACDVVAGRNSSGSISQCQCSTGRTGMLCGACQSGEDTPNGLDWVHSGGECKVCSTTRRNATVIVVVIFLLVILFAVLLSFLFKRLTQMPLIEKRFVEAFSNLDSNPEETGWGSVADDFFGPGSRHGIKQEVFMAKCTAALSKSITGPPSFASASGVVGASSDWMMEAAPVENREKVAKDVMRLWDKVRF